ncbi:MAG TPA: glycosyltransferase [Flavobacteriales bacterium]|nr:glycosyltransferase [Flavobacteriales bacterium]
MIRICLLADSSSIHTVRWCRHFTSVGYHIEVISFKNVSIEGIKVHYLDVGPIDVAGGNWRVLMHIGKAKKLVKQINPDVLHAHYATSYGIVGALVKFKPYIVTALGSDVLISARRSKIYRALVKFVFRRASHVTAMAPHMQKVMEEMGVPASKISVVMFGIDPAVFNRNGRNVSKDKFIITSTRNFEPVYNHQLLFDALVLVKDKIKNLHVNMIGQGTQREFFQNFVRGNDLGDKIHFLGKVTQQEIAVTLRQTHLFITVALSDGNCISLNEAMACGTFSIAGDIEATRQWITEGENGFLVPLDKPAYLAEKIMHVYGNYDALIGKATAVNDTLIAQKAVWSVNMQQMDNIYKNLVKK